MTRPDEPIPPPPERSDPSPYVQGLRAAARFSAAALTVIVLMVGPTIFLAEHGSAAILVMVVVAAAAIVLAVKRIRRPGGVPVAAGLWAGIAVGFLLGGLCYSIIRSFESH